jgi:putative ABC transport system permease protein
MNNEFQYMKGKEIKTQPPAYAFRLLAWFCPPDLYEGIEGDLLEQFQEDAQLSSSTIARRRFVLNVCRFIRPGIIFRNRFSLSIIQYGMLRNHIKLTLRNLLKSKGYSFINIFGLAVGVASCLLILSYIRFELSFDKTHPAVDRLYRVNQTLIWRPGGGVFSSTGPQLAFALREDYPEVESVVRINTPGQYTVHLKEAVKSFRESRVFAADSNFFSFFDFRLKEGDPRTALIGPDKVVISDEVAYKFFGNEPAVGKMLQFDGANSRTVEVSGVTEPQPKNIHLHFDYLLSIQTNPAIRKFEWSFIWTQVVTYVKLRPGVNVAELEKKLQTIGPRRIVPSFVRLGMDYNEFVRDKGGWSFYLQPVRDIRLRSAGIWNNFEETGDIAYLYLFGGICLFILVIASINFINLSTARASMRAKEVGVKKTLGAHTGNLILQFQMESIFVCILATLLAVALMGIMKTLILGITGFDLPLSLKGDSGLVLWIVALPLVLGFLAGLYPSFYLTAFKPAQVLKGRLASGMKSGGLRSALVLVQFVIAITLMAVTLVVQQQIRYMANMNLGFDKENILLIQHADELGNQLESFRNEVTEYPGVIQASTAMGVPGRGNWEDIFGAEGSTASLPIHLIKIDHHYFKTLGLKLVTGRELDENSAADQHAVVLNENAVKLFGWTPEEAIGKHMIYPDGSKMPVIGVVRDFHFRSLREPIAPLIFLSIKEAQMYGDMRIVAIKFKADDVAALRARIEKRWSELAPTAPIELSFFEEDLEKQYQNEQRLAGLFSVFTAFSIGVGIIGLIGLVAFSADQRRKEIGIRKVFGASIASIFVMMNTQYVKLMIVAAVIAAPLSWWMLDRWLSEFAYHIDVSPLVFVICGVVEILIAVVCVSYLSIRAARLNPASALKEE